MINLLIRAFGGLVFLVAVLALALFIPAGTLAYWQAWLFLAVWTVCIVLITGYLVRKDPALLERRVQAGPVAETSRTQQIIQSIAGLSFLLIFVMSGLDFRFHWSSVPAALVIVAELVVALGLYFVFLVFRENSFTSATIEVAAEQKVVSTGPYALVRHPMYAGALLMMIFVPIALGSWVGVLFTLPLIVAIVVRLLDEEKVLAQSLPGYTDYTQKVRYHLIPYVW
jgi:protein-S-isoprenylcysteine O-methyltransferase Ste14